MTKQTVSTIESVKHGIVSTIKGAGDVSGAMVDAVSKTVGWAFNKTPAQVANLDIQYSRISDGEVFSRRL